MNYYGFDSFTFYASDGEWDSDIGTIIIDIQPVNDEPEAISINIETSEDTNVTIELLGNGSIETST